MTLDTLIQTAHAKGMLQEINGLSLAEAEIAVLRRLERDKLIAAYEQIRALEATLADFPYGPVYAAHAGLLTSSGPAPCQPEMVGQFRANLTSARIALVIHLQYEHGYDVETEARRDAFAGDPFADEEPALPATRPAPAAPAPRRRVVCTHGDPCLCAEEPYEPEEEHVQELLRRLPGMDVHALATCGLLEGEPEATSTRHVQRGDRKGAHNRRAGGERAAFKADLPRGPLSRRPGGDHLPRSRV